MSDTRKLHDALLTDAHLADIRTKARKAHPNDVATDAEIEADLANAVFAEDGALEVRS